MNNKEIAIEFLTLIIQGNIDEAYKQFVDPEGNHHNIHFKAGFEELKSAMILDHKLHPGKSFEMIQVIAEEDRVAIHSKMEVDQHTFSIAHFFNFINGKIVEMWDIVQEIPKKISNEDGAF